MGELVFSLFHESLWGTKKMSSKNFLQFSILPRTAEFLHLLGEGFTQWACIYVLTRISSSVTIILKLRCYIEIYLLLYCIKVY